MNRGLIRALVLAAVATAVGLVSAQNLPLPALPYEYGALAPFIDEATMRVHHLKHHAGYTDRVNAVLSEMRAAPEHKALAKLGLDALLGRMEAVPGQFQERLRNFGGGYVNHALFFASLTPALPADPATGVVPYRRPHGALGAAITEMYGSFDKFKELFTELGVGLFGSGWVWLSLVPRDDVVLSAGERAAGAAARAAKLAMPYSLTVGTTMNQDSPLMQKQIPILALDVWEHAYYLQHQNRRDLYVDAWWKVVNWSYAERLYNDALGIPNPPAPKTEL